MFMVEIAGVRVLYTGDFSRQEDRHLMGAELPSLKPDILIVESTYGVNNHEPRRTREERFTETVSEIVKRGGRCLIPVFAMGRTQELLLILEEYWAANPDIQHVKVYYSSNMAKACTVVFQTFKMMMNERIRENVNLFDFKFIQTIRNVDEVEETGPCVVMASPGMLQSGPSRILFDRWCQDSRNGVLIPGYSVEGTLAHTILTDPDTVTLLTGERVPLRCSVSYISFSAHSDYRQTREFIDQLSPLHVVLVHGARNEMLGLKNKLTDDFAERNMSVQAPANRQTVQFEFRSEKMAKMFGELAVRCGTGAGADGDLTAAKRGQDVDGILLHKNCTYHLMSREDLPKFSQLSSSSIQQTTEIPFLGQSDQLQLLLDAMRETFADVLEVKVQGEEEGGGGIVDQDAVYWIDNTVSFKQVGGNTLVVTWSSSPTADLLADAALALILEVQISPAMQLHSYPRTERDRLLALKRMLTLKYGPVLEDAHTGDLTLLVNGEAVRVDKSTLTVTDSSSESVKMDVESSIAYILATFDPIPTLFSEKERERERDQSAGKVKVEVESM